MIPKSGSYFDPENGIRISSIWAEAPVRFRPRLQPFGTQDWRQFWTSAGGPLHRRPGLLWRISCCTAACQPFVVPWLSVSARGCVSSQGMKNLAARLHLRRSLWADLAVWRFRANCRYSRNPKNGARHETTCFISLSFKFRPKYDPSFGTKNFLGRVCFLFQGLLRKRVARNFLLQVRFPCSYLEDLSASGFTRHLLFAGPT